MFHSIKRFWFVLALLLGGVQSMWGFALLGPINEPYQMDPTIGYGLSPIQGMGNAFPVDIGAPKNFGQGYRWNTPTNYYAFDASFATFFGSNGMAAVDQAFAMFNSLSNVSSYSPTLSEWPFKSSRVNFNAEALGLLDLKSATMQIMIEELGLASPDRWTWALHDRFLPSGAVCPDFEYIVIQRNFDPVTDNYSAYVNGELLGYTILDLCGLTVNPAAPFEADAEEFSTDPKYTLTAVAAGALTEEPGTFFTGFTRDDIGGLRYLYGANTVFNEPGDTNSVVFATNSTTTLLTTFNLAIFEAQALTNAPTMLSNLYPGLIITSTTNSFRQVVTTNFTFELVSVPQAPAGIVTLVPVVTLTTNFQELFFNTYANLVILHMGGLATETILQTSVTKDPHSPANTPIFDTNVVATLVLTPFTNGDFYILQANQCAPDVILPIAPLGTLTSITNQLPVVVLSGTAIPTTFVFNEVQTFTNFTYQVQEVDCASNNATVRQGMEHITFVRRDFDPLLSANWVPVTNTYHLTAVTNTAIVQTLQRVVSRPDILFTTADLTAGPGGMPLISVLNRSVPNFNTPNNGQPGPGTISPGITITLNDIGPVAINDGPYFHDIGGLIGIGGTPGTNSAFNFQWGSFDATTNAPVIYPSTASLISLEAELYFQVTTPLMMPSGKVGSVYIPNGLGMGTNGFQLQAAGATQFLPPQSPYLWSTNAPGLPAGLMLSTTGIISGTPTTAGTNQFTVQVTDAGARTAFKSLQIIITQ
ncbi:MAG TPA: Ig domain-containing protein [Verrucomicrobiae bacterium]|jgi:hypothetical protein|nr:Ig domain-containing protein [Verrucomicrobiae bacterium]